MAPELAPNSQLKKIEALLAKILTRLDKIEKAIEKQERPPALANPARK